MYEVISAIVDNGEFLEVQPHYAKNIIIGFARFNGQSVGIVANQPKYQRVCLTAMRHAKVLVLYVSATLSIYLLFH